MTTGHFRVTSCLCIKRVLVLKFFREDEFDLHDNERAGKTHFQMNGFTRRLFLIEAKDNSEIQKAL